MIAAGGRDDPGHIWPRALQIVHVDDAAAHLKGACRRVVLVLHPHLAARPLGKKRPGILRRWWYDTMHELGCGFQLGKGEERIRRVHQKPPGAAENDFSSVAFVALSRA